MLQSLSEQSQSQQALLGHLAPPEHKPTIIKQHINLNRKQKLDKELKSQANSKQLNRRRKEKEDRSRSRDNKIQSRHREGMGERGIRDWMGRNRDNVKMEERMTSREDVIVISDDQKENKRERRNEEEEDDFGDDNWERYPTDGLNWRERRKIDRIMQRGIRYFRQGKPRDELSNKIFNTIQDYFR